MISHKKLLPLVETGMDNSDEYSIKTYDIWLFERSQVFNIKDYDEDFATLLLDKIEKFILEHGTPDFEVDSRSKSHSYQLNKLQRHSSKLKDIRERIALDFFFVQDKCYPYTNDITITRTHPDYLFWFSLKLRQYDLSLINTSKFLDFQLRKNNKNDSEEFIEHLDICIKQYPYLFSDRLIERINKWIEKLSQKKSKSNSVAQIDNEMKATGNQDLELVVQTDNGNTKPVSFRRNSISKFTLIDPIKDENKWEFLCNSLISFLFIDEIDFKVFINHFKGNYEGQPKINWIKERSALIHMINKLIKYMNSEVYTNESISVGYLVNHFLHNNKDINSKNWRETKYKNKINVGKKRDEKSIKAIDLIINQMEDIK